MRMRSGRIADVAAPMTHEASSEIRGPRSVSRTPRWCSAESLEESLTAPSLAEPPTQMNRGVAGQTVLEWLGKPAFPDGWRI